MLGFVSHKRQVSFPIGVDLGFDAVRLLQLCARPDGSLAVAASARHTLWDRSESRDPVARLEEGLSAVSESLLSGHFSSRNVIAALPRRDVHVRTLCVPLSPSMDDHALIEREAAAALPFTLDAASTGFIHAGEVCLGNGDVRREVIAVAAARQDVDDFLERLHAAGTRCVSALDVQPLAIHRASMRCAPCTDGSATMLLDIGGQASEIVIASGEGSRVRVIRTINIGGRKLNGAVARRLGISEDDARQLRERLETSASEASGASVARSIRSRDPRDAVRRSVFDAVRSVVADLAAEVMLCIRDFSNKFRGHPVTRVLLSGGEARFEQIGRTLSEGLGVPVDVAPLFKGIAGSPARSDSDAAEWGVAMGLALRGICDQGGEIEKAAQDRHAEVTHA